jgi:molybdopterin-guanine dinucleotide biosynthesis protein A
LCRHTPEFAGRNPLAVLSFLGYFRATMVPSVPVYVLAGGHSRRFGSDKARVLVGDEPLLTYVALGLAGVASRLAVVADAPGRYDDLGLPTLGDALAGQGPMGGLERALGDLAPGEEWLLLAPCDLLGIAPSWLETLLEARAPQSGVVAFRGARWEPMPALYHADLRDRVRARLAAGQRSLWRLIEAADPIALPHPPGWEQAVQVNTPADLERYLRRQPTRS